MDNLLFSNEWRPQPNDIIISKIRKLIEYHQKGVLGGEIMPEDANPGLPKKSKDNFHFFTLPMALNYQRNSYKLWPAALNMYNNPETRILFDPKEVIKIDKEYIRKILVDYKVALQPNKHIGIWIKLSQTIVEYFDGDIRNLFAITDNHVGDIKYIVQKEKKKDFPYLSGNKICNYWLYVIEQYTDTKLKARELISVAPDTHVIQSSIKLGLINPKILDNPKLREIVSNKWVEILKDTDLVPIDIHTPLWLWSRNKFIIEI